jgi:hypothetical protein
MNEELIVLLDSAIKQCSSRDNMPTNDIADILLDMRLLLMTQEEKEITK